MSCQTDAMGNPIRISEGGIVKTLSWGEGRMLLGVRTNASNYSQYFYGVDGLRTRKVVAVNGIKTTTEYAWGDNGLAGTIIRNGTATTTVVPHYDGDGEAIGFTVKHVPSKLVGPSTTNTYIYVKNLQGDVLRILDSNGNAVVNYAYDPWGKPTVTGDEELAALNPCSYRGYDYDEETGYYYLKTRYYNSETFRFLNADDTSFIGASGTVLSYNVFTYCENNPINLSDEFGCIAIPWQIKVGLAAGVASAIWEAVKYVKNNPKQSKTSWKFIKGLSKAITRGFVRGFLVGVLTSLSQSWRYGAIGGTLNLLYTITVNRSQGRSTSVDQGVSAFMNGWSTAVYSKTLSNVLKRVSRICKWSSKSADTLEYILDTMLGLGISHYFKW